MPKISVFTPSHDPRWLDECYASLAAQTFPDWEWHVLLNNGATWHNPVPDDRVWTDEADDERSVGALKRDVVNRCDGHLLVELDHDDLLEPDALEIIDGICTANPEASLIYSDTVQINEDGTPNLTTFDPAHGWRYEAADIGGPTPGICAGAMEPTPHNVSYIWYAPNHVRAFPRWAYELAGGYNPSLEVCDDQDLMARLYQVGPFVHYPGVLYRQRVHPANTQKERNALIQSESLRLYDKWIEPNALAWAKREGLAALDLGGAHNSPPGYTSVDMAPGAEIQADVLTYLLGLPESSVGVIRAADFLEHVPVPIHLMNEIHRVLAPNGLLLSCTPSTDGRGAFQDPTHVSFWNENSFWYYTDPELAKYVPAITARFQVSRLVSYFPSDWHQANSIPYVQANLIAVKDGGVRDGGILHW